MNNVRANCRRPLHSNYIFTNSYNRIEYLIFILVQCSFFPYKNTHTFKSQRGHAIDMEMNTMMILCMFSV